MLANLLPGIREIRTPLATGYLWLLTFWLWLPAHLKKNAPTSGILGEFTQLAHYVGRIGIGIAISFVAYLIGILSQFLRGPVPRLGTISAYIPKFIRSRNIYGSNFNVSLGSFLMAPFVNYYPNDYRDVSPEYARRRLGNQIAFALANGTLSTQGLTSLNEFMTKMVDANEINGLRQRQYLAYLVSEVPGEGNALVGRESELYSLYDRLISEYEFRIGISIPLTALIITLAISWSPLFLIALLPLLVLLGAGSNQRMDAGDLLADAVRLGRITIALPGWAKPVNPPDADHHP
jgi:hypothetical protein